MIATLVDTNIFVYAMGVGSDNAKHDMAIQSIAGARATAAISLQVLSELASVLLRKGWDPDRVSYELAEIAATWTVLRPDAATGSLALQGVESHHLSFWDAMMWAISKQNGLSVILSEDGPTGSIVGGIRYVSPF